MRNLRWLLLLLPLTSVRVPAQEISAADGVRIREFYRFAARIQDKIWPGWSRVPAPLLLVTKDTEFLTHDPSPPKDFVRTGEDFFTRPRQFPLDLQATFPAFGPPSVIVIGEPENTISKTSTPWLITLMHEHFHQLQNAQPGYDHATERLGLRHSSDNGMWMLNYPFPYATPEVMQAFRRLRDRLLSTVNEPNRSRFWDMVDRYRAERVRFFAQLSPDDHKYFDFQVGQEGIARYTEIKCVQAAAQYQPSSEFSGLSDYTAFSDYAGSARQETLDELRRIDKTQAKRVVVYSLGAAEGLLLDRINPNWKDEYFQNTLSLDALFRK